ncbi:FadR family transcriptional regulator [Kribbella sandramycini]|uniref:FadR family transcriptional regulator n=1 Tax=Kribbella sandramycini TaxID=60450 RepID=A0A7Y4L1M5_9ACTN|nr:FCD domain-containing protein [Kribbella sandramycini]MBB6565342.1 GntR family transcriptional repressor for pyruvate dehydrogenase complex [Kribbella sandramycini]NOL41611.1 FadR family transcriptional regulator [Kribbella sandramycini]
MTAVVRRSLLDDLATSMLDLIADRKLAVGDQFESVRSLAERFQVAVPTVREALRRLEAIGALELRHGSGVYVGPNVGRMVLANPLPLKPTAGRLVELLQARALIEPPVAALAAKARVESALAQMEHDLVQAAELITSGDHDRLAEINMDFHRALAQAAGNATLAEVVESVTVVNVREQLEILHIHGDRETDLAEHRAILAAVRAGDHVLAEQLTRAHLDGVLAVINARVNP